MLTNSDYTFLKNLFNESNLILNQILKELEKLNDKSKWTYHSKSGVDLQM